MSSIGSRSYLGPLASILAAAALAACGGGGGDSPSASASGTPAATAPTTPAQPDPAPPAPPQASTPLVITGLDQACTGCGAATPASYAGSGVGIWTRANGTGAAADVQFSIAGLSGQSVSL
ncbi:hypothetical protein [Cupriavidus sp. IDO]|uniref:hypothetical protein n=1 Tax=Cupriavidus sp. IDO TaxID=1539142 RepID=UPI0005796FC0|nr:hypothetical protein [Cupriavidus sp. IDO]KWR87433.1 hypothetical protein RM96_25605 [Cupriavidus sp. IDO]